MILNAVINFSDGNIRDLLSETFSKKIVVKTLLKIKENDILKNHIFIYKIKNNNKKLFVDSVIKYINNDNKIFIAIGDCDIINDISYDKCKKFYLPFKLNDINNIIDNFINYYNNNYILIKDTEIDYQNKVLYYNDKYVFLTEKESELIYFIYKKKTTTKKDILLNIWKRNKDNIDNKVLESLLYNLKQKLKTIDFPNELIIMKDDYYEFIK